MGCCSGRCTLAFICGMQLVSVEIIWSDRFWNRRVLNQRQSVKWLNGWMGGWQGEDECKEGHI